MAVCAVQCVEEQKLPDPLPVVALVNRQATEQRGGNQGVARQCLGDLNRKFADVGPTAREGVVSQDCRAARRRKENERRGAPPARILPGLFTDILIKGRVAA